MASLPLSPSSHLVVGGRWSVVGGRLTHHVSRFTFHSREITGQLLDHTRSLRLIQFRAGWVYSSTIRTVTTVGQCGLPIDASTEADHPIP
jgi:hypothetical protein